jgi:hypothetical protein
MAEGKDIPINIKTTSDNSGIEDAAKAARRLDYELKKANAAAHNNTQGETASPWAGQLEKTKHTFDELGGSAEKAAEKIDEVTEATEELGEATNNARKPTAELDENVDNIARAQKGRAIADLADKVGLIAAKFRDTANEVREYDKAAADALDQTADRIDMVSSSVSTLAMGFAVGGPLGAGVAAVGIGVKELMNSFQEAEVAGIKAAAAQKKSLEESAQAARDAAIEAEARANELKSQEIEDAIRRQNEALADGLDLLERQLDAARKKRREKEEVLSAEDDLALANIDVNEASGKITNEEAEKQRAEVAVGAKKRAADERAFQAFEAAAKADEEAKAKENTAGGIKVQAAQAQILADELQRRAEEAALKKDIAKKMKAYAEAVAAANEASQSKLTTDWQTQQHESATNAAWADLQKTPWQQFPNINQDTVDTDSAKASAEASRAASAAAKIKAEAEAAKMEADKSRTNAGFTQQQSADTIATVDQKAEIEAQTRAARENALQLSRDAKAREAAQKKADDERKASARDREQRTGAEAGIGNSAMSLLPKGVVEEFRQSVQRAAKGLQDGDQGGEIEELMKLMNQLAGAVQVKGTKTEVSLANLAARIKQLENKP